MHACAGVCEDREKEKRKNCGNCLSGFPKERSVKKIEEKK
jgi:hypothetical protein